MPMDKKARPILFSGPMVRALLGGHKTQTRRVVKPSVKGCTVGAYTGGRNGTQPVNVQEDGDPWDDIPSPYGKPGDLLWVRETWAEVGTMDPGYLVYRATYPSDVPRGVQNVPADIRDAGYRWVPSIHMPRRASRLTLRITNVRVEHLNSITPEDAYAEGRSLTRGDDRGYFPDTWEAINGAGSWAENPWVWALTFEVIKSNVDQVLQETA
jgi:hypothetical protein